MLIAPQNPPADEALRVNLQSVRLSIATAAKRAGRSEDSVTIVAVSKGQTPQRVAAAARLGVRDFGESYLQEALPKVQALDAQALSWHFIGRVQSNKTRPLAEHFDWVHGVDRLSVAERLSQQRSVHRAALNVCLQVNIAQEASKAGISLAEAAPLAQAVARLPRLRLRGLMCLLPADQPDAENRAHFSSMTMLLKALNQAGLTLDTLSMGMSADYPVAVEEGATLVRIGTAIFGTRPAA